MVKVHPAGSLLKPARIFPGVLAGEAEGGEVIMSSLSRQDPVFGMDALPFIVSGYADARRMWKISRPLVEKAMKKYGLVLLYAVPWPPQNLYSRVPIESFESFKGMRIRTYNPATDRIAQLVHATPVKIEVVNLQKAIADGQLDMMITSSWTGVETQSWSTLRYYYRVSAWIPKNMVFIREKVFDALDAQTRQQMMRLAQVAEERGWRMSQNSDEGYENQLAAHKVNVSTMEFFNREYLDRIGETLAREWLKRAGPDELKMLLQYTTSRSVGQAAGK
jgi:TRAP-type C4-dicarboxylate transport system substrate-binding protein